MTEVNEIEEQKKPQPKPNPLKDENAGVGGSYIINPKTGTRKKVKDK